MGNAKLWTGRKRATFVALVKPICSLYKGHIELLSTKQKCGRVHPPFGLTQTGWCLFACYSSPTRGTGKNHDSGGRLEGQQGADETPAELRRVRPEKRGVGVLEDSAKENSGNQYIILAAENKNLLVEKAQNRVTGKEGEECRVRFHFGASTSKVVGDSWRGGCARILVGSSLGPPDAVQLLSLPPGVQREKLLVNTRATCTFITSRIFWFVPTPGINKQQNAIKS